VVLKTDDIRDLSRLRMILGLTHLGPSHRERQILQRTHLCPLSLPLFSFLLPLILLTLSSCYGRSMCDWEDPLNLIPEKECFRARMDLTLSSIGQLNT